jgi:hypothetical protein
MYRVGANTASNGKVESILKAAQAKADVDGIDAQCKESL